MSDGAVHLDLDARRAEQSDGIKKVVTLGGNDYELPPRMPLYFAQYLMAGRFADAVALLFGAEHEPVVGPLLDFDGVGGDLTTITRELYGFTVGEASPSSPPSNRAGRRSRATSKGSTASA